ncbi:hypothetical protein [Rhizobacter sp. Root404]|uniref:hypothetical protein n=1 Tax=Rhizobacter sp. Root404 TaxID=1736528 RepID=UPI000B0D839A|nr:hypothetical protein [Rhizobacter sp. Root404]
MNTPRFIPVLLNALTSLALALSALAVSAAGAKANSPPSPDPAVVKFLVESSAKDFKASGANRPTDIRGARIGFFTESGKSVYLLCGSFKSGAGSQAKWTHFATIKTSDYEQWVGGAARAYCEQRTNKWFPEHSAALETELKD